MSTESQLLLVHAYVDGELDPASALAVRAQIDQNPRLAAEFAAASALQKTLRETFPREPLPAAFRYRVDTTVGRRKAWSRPSWGALAASVLVAVSLSSASTWFASHVPAGDHVLDEIVDSHMRSLIASKPTEVAASERHVIKPWFNGRIPQAPRVVDLKAEGFPLLGARIDVIGKTPVPTLVYTRRLHTISLIALPAADGTQAVASARMDSGYNIVRWADGNTRYVATSDLNAGELVAFAKAFRSAD
jgi:anti-sigma factor RsiW